jgi:hypothetical protein
MSLYRLEVRRRAVPNAHEPEDFYEHRDEELSMRLPSYLRQKKRGMLCFEAPSKKRADCPIQVFAIGFLTDYLLEARREMMMFDNPQNNQEIMGVRGELLRRGKPAYLANGLEYLNATHMRATGQTFYGYEVLYPLGPHHVSATFFGQAVDPSTFEKACIQIISSVRLVESGETPLPPPRHRFPSGGLERADTNKLKAVLDALPPDIAYLRRPILAIAKEDQDLLSSGEADLQPVERAIQKNLKGHDIAATVTAHADLLHTWLSSLPDHNAAWTAPVVFVEGVLRGRAQFGGDSPAP